MTVTLTWNYYSRRSIQCSPDALLRLLLPSRASDQCPPQAAPPKSVHSVDNASLGDLHDYDGLMSQLPRAYGCALLPRARRSWFIPWYVLDGIFLTLMLITVGINYYLSCWYKRSEFGIRAAIFFSAAAVSGSFGGLLAAAIGKMDGVGGKKGWAWIFILEGLATIVIGIISYWMVFDFPDEATFLSDVDRQRVIRRLKADQQSSAEHEDFKTAYFWASVRDWKTPLFAIIYAGADMPLYAFSLFLPSIISSVSSTSLSENWYTIGHTDCRFD